jgi:hypothetical protein
VTFAKNEGMQKGSSVSKGRLLDSSSWSILLDVHGSSGLSVKDFCASQGVIVSSYYLWRKRLQECNGSGSGLFNPIEISAKPSGDVTVVELPGGILLRFMGLPPVDYLRQLSATFSGGLI